MKNKILELSKYIGNTKILKANNLMRKYNLKSNLYLKIESSNYSGSIKDRLVYYIIKDAIEKDIINKNTIILEATSGNTGISIAAISYYLGIKCIIVMPESVSIERIKILENYNAEVILTPSEEGMSGSIKKVEELKRLYDNHFTLDQFNNPLGVLAHYYTTGPEIYKDLKTLDIFVCGIGTGTTFTGCCQYLKEKNKDIYCIGVEPFESNVLKGNNKSSHLIEGIGAGFIPKVLDVSLLDEVIDVKSLDAYKYTNILYKEENLKCGISSGAALFAGINLCKKYTDKNILVILPDDGNRYISKGVFDEGFKIN